MGSNERSITPLAKELDARGYKHSIVWSDGERAAKAIVSGAI